MARCSAARLEDDPDGMAFERPYINPKGSHLAMAARPLQDAPPSGGIVKLKYRMV